MAYKRDLLTGFGKEVYILQNIRSFNIGECDMMHSHIACQLYIFLPTLRLGIRNLPCPNSGAAVGFCELAVLFIYIYKAHIAVVRFRLFINQFEYAPGARKRHYDAVELLGDHRNGHGKLSCQSEK